MKASLLTLLIGLAAVGALFAQDATVTAATLDITLTNPTDGSRTVTYVFPTATGTPISGATVAIRSNDVITLSNAAAIVDEGACTLTGARLEVGFPTLAPFIASVSLPLGAPQGCPAPGPPANLPACAPGDQVFLVGPGGSVSIDLIGQGVTLADGFTLPLSVGVIPEGTGCSIVPRTVNATLLVDNFSALPVTLTSFSARREGPRDVVEWTAESEIDLAGYSVEQSLDGEHFAEVRYVAALGTEAGARAYAADIAAVTDAPQGTVYYRLRSVDLDGSSALSDVVAVGRAGGGITERALVAYPNPSAAGAGFAVAIPADAAATLEVFDLRGRRVLLREGVSAEAIGQELTSGTYLVRVTAAASSGHCRIVVH